MQSKRSQAKKQQSFQRPSPKRETRPRKGPYRRDRAPGFASEPQARVQTIGAAMGRTAPTAYFKRGGIPQKVTDQDYSGSERISGCDLFSSAFVNNTTTDSGFPAGAFWASLSPSLISSRLAAIEETYQWNAIRRLKLHYSPTVGSTTPNSIAIGISTDPEISVAITAPTQQQVMELQPSMLSPVWGFTSCELLMRGTKLFESYAASGEQLDTHIQARIAAAYSGVASAAITTGQLWLEYDIDFYQQTPLLSSVDLFKSGRPCPRCHQVLVRDPRESKLLTVPHKGQNSYPREERKTPSVREPDSPVLVSGLSTPSRQEVQFGNELAPVRSAHGAKASSSKGSY